MLLYDLLLKPESIVDKSSAEEAIDVKDIAASCGMETQVSPSKSSTLTNINIDGMTGGIDVRKLSERFKKGRESCAKIMQIYEMQLCGLESAVTTN